MATSLVSLHRKSSSEVWMASLVFLAVIVSLTTARVVPAHGDDFQRVGRPCSGRHGQSVHVTPSSNDIDHRLSHHQLRREVHSVSNLLTRLYTNVDQFRTNYVAERDVVDIGMHMDGMPRSEEIRVVISPHSQDVDLAATVADITSKLSRVAVIISLIRLEEERHEPHPFRDALQMIEDHAEHGLYGILCRLHAIHRLVSATTGDADVDLVAEIDSALAGVRLIDTPRDAYRHLRTVSVLRDFAHLLQHLIVVLGHAV